MASVGFGFREVIVDEPFGGKWMDVDMNLGGGHGTFQGTKFCDRAGGFSYKAAPSPRQIMQNRFIYWRVLNDMLELTEISMDYNLEDNQIRYIFRDSPIVSPISIQEEEEQITIMVVTVTSVNRFSFTHPNRLYSDDGFKRRNRQPSIFHQVLNKPSMTFKSFNLFDHAINIPVPTTAAAQVMPNRGGHIFALAYESGSVTVCKISSDDTLVLYDLRQANIFTRILSFTPSYLRGPSNSIEAAIGLQFFSAKIERRMKMVLVALTMNGHLMLYICNNQQSLNDWTVSSDVLVDRRFAMDGYTDCNMLLRMCDSSSNSSSARLPLFIIFVPGEGFRLFAVMRNSADEIRAGTGSFPLELIPAQSIDFRESSGSGGITDFCVTNDFLFILVSNLEEETEWEVKSYALSETVNPRFNLALLEPPPFADVSVFPGSLEPKEFYFDLVFNKSGFSALTIYNALSTFESSSNLPKYENDWEQTKQFAVSVIENEIRMDVTETDEPLLDEDYYELVLRYWLGFYNSCVEYHINTVKPLGLFFETNTGMVCVVKKSRISFLRPTDFFETLYYFPLSVSMSPEADEGHSHQIAILLKYFEMMLFIDSTMDQMLKNRVNKRLIENRSAIQAVCVDIANLLAEADPYTESEHRRHFIPMLSSKLREIGAEGDNASRLLLNLFASWDRESELLDLGQGHHGLEEDERNFVTEFFMGSKHGANITYKVFKQLLGHRFVILRSTLILQSLLTNFFVRNVDPDIRMVPSLQDQKEAQEAFIHSFGLMGLLEKSAEFVPDSLLERGQKVANTLNAPSVDHSLQSKLIEFWPMKLIEMFCHSTSGGLAIRSRVLNRNSKIISYADAAGRAIWPNKDSIDHPFEEFLVSACQYTALAQYATNMGIERPNGRLILKKFYQGVADLFTGDYDLALGRFRSISVPEIVDDVYVCNKILGWQEGSGNFPPILFFQKVINLFQIFNHIISVQAMAAEALLTSPEPKWARVMSALGFKSALQIGDYPEAYGFIRSMPPDLPGTGKEKSSSLRTFIGQILERGDIQVLMSLDMQDGFFRYTSTSEEIDKILSTHSKLSNPLAEDGIYQMIYLYYLAREDYRKAASCMLERIIHIGAKGRGTDALRAQRDSYLDVLTCLSLVNDKLFAFAARNEDSNLLSVLSCLKWEDDEILSPDAAAAQSAAGSSVAERPKPIKKKKAIGERMTTEGELPLPPDGSEDVKISDQIRTYEDARRECELCNCLLLLEDKLASDPIKFGDAKRRAEEAVEYLTLAYRFDDAIRLAALWNISFRPVVLAFAKVCVNLHYDILPRDGDPSEYTKYLDVSELPTTGTNVIELTFMLLQNFIKKLEKPRETYIHQDVALEFLSYSLNLPRWLVDSYKKRDSAQLLNCYLRYGEWEEATAFAADVIDAALGRRNAIDFDPSIQTVTAYVADPVIPYTAIDELAAELQARGTNDTKCQQLYRSLKDRCDDYVIRVNETRQERLEMFS